MLVTTASQRLLRSRLSTSPFAQISAPNTREHRNFLHQDRLSQLWESFSLSDRHAEQQLCNATRANQKVPKGCDPSLCSNSRLLHLHHQEQLSLAQSDEAKRYPAAPACRCSFSEIGVRFKCSKKRLPYSGLRDSDSSFIRLWLPGDFRFGHSTVLPKASILDPARRSTPANKRS